MHWHTGEDLWPLVLCALLLSLAWTSEHTAVSGGICQRVRFLKRTNTTRILLEPWRM